MLDKLKKFWERVTTPDNFIGVTTSDRVLDLIPENEGIYPMQTWTPRVSDDPHGGTDVYIVSTDAEDDTVTFAMVNKPDVIDVKNRKMFLRTYKRTQPDARFDHGRGEIVPL